MSALPDTLPCGRDADALLERVADGGALDEHERRCPHCGAVADEAARLWSEVGRLRAEPVAAPPDLVAGVLARIGQPVGRGVELPEVPVPWTAGATVPIDRTPLGTTAVTERTLVRLVGEVVRRTPGIARIADIAVEVGRREFAVVVRVAVDDAAPVPATVEVVRAAVADEVERHTHLAVVAVDVTVVAVVAARRTR